MYLIEAEQHTLPDGVTITKFSREITSANILSVEAGTTGYMGGDTGHGGRTYFCIKNCGGTDIRVRLIVNGQPIGDGEHAENGWIDGFEVILGGDTELETIIRALKFIVKVLEDGAEGVND